MLYTLLHAGLLSGTRSAYASFTAGIIVVTFMYGQRIQLITVLLGSILYGVLRFTTVGASYTIIRRINLVLTVKMHLLVRIANRLKLDQWLLTPIWRRNRFGFFDKRFAPDSFMSTFPQTASMS